MPLAMPSRHIAKAALLLLLLPALAQSTGKPDPPCQSKVRDVRFPQPTKYPATPQPHLHPHTPILRTHTDHLYRTTIRQAAASGANFAGHYVIADWGCGTGCNGFVIIDLRTGKVFDPGFDDISYHYPPSDDAPVWSCFDDLLIFSKKSRLLVLEGCLNETGECGRHFYEMTPTGLHLLTYDPDLNPDGTQAVY